MSVLLQVIFGWPATIHSIVFSVANILKKWPWVLLVGGLICAPFAVYISGYPLSLLAPVVIPKMCIPDKGLVGVTHFTFRPVIEGPAK